VTGLPDIPNPTRPNWYHVFGISDQAHQLDDRLGAQLEYLLDSMWDDSLVRFNDDYNQYKECVDKAIIRREGDYLSPLLDLVKRKPKFDAEVFLYDSAMSE
jgi:hypothetical protein